MKKLTVFSVIILACLGLLLVTEQGDSARRQRDPNEKQTTFKNLEMNVQNMGDRGYFLSGTQGYYLRQSNKTRDRSCTFYNDGLLLVFVGSNDYDVMSKSTGSRTYRLLPYGEVRVPSFSQKDESTIEGLLPNGDKAYFSTETGELTGIEGYTVTITSPIVHFDQMMKAKGGLEIRPEKGKLLIDYGWMRGSTSYTRLGSPSIIYDGYGNACNVRNSDLSVQNPKDRDEVIQRFKTNDQFKAFLKKKCPKLRME